MLSLKQIKFCAEECERQRSGELSVGWMCEALEHLLINKTEIESSIGTEDFSWHIRTVASFCEPLQNARGFRKTPVYFNDYSFGMDAELIPQAMKNLCLAELIPEDFYTEFQRIHPFQDSNGRCGALLFNLMKNSLDNPQKPPKFIGKIKENE